MSYLETAVSMSRMVTIVLAVLNVSLCGLLLAYIGPLQQPTEIKYDDSKRKIILGLASVHVVVYSIILLLTLSQENFANERFFFIAQLTFYIWVVRLMSIQNLNEPEKVWQLTVTRVLAYIILFVPSTLSGLFLISLTEDQFAENSVPGMSYMAAVFLVVAVQRFMHEGS